MYYLAITFIFWWLLGGYCPLPSGYCSLPGGYWGLLLVTAWNCSFPLLVWTHAIYAYTFQQQQQFIVREKHYVLEHGFKIKRGCYKRDIKTRVSNQLRYVWNKKICEIRLSTSAEWSTFYAIYTELLELENKVHTVMVNFFFMFFFFLLFWDPASILPFLLSKLVEKFLICWQILIL